MNINKKLNILFIIALLLATVLIYFGQPRTSNTPLQTNDPAVYNEVELEYFRQAERLNDYYARFDVSTRISVIRETLKSIDIYLPKYFPEGPYTREDLVSIAMVESAFDQYLTGSSGEYGIFQIMPESSEWAGVKKNQYDVEVNTEMALFVLKKKFEKHKDYKLGIIAYNGIVKRRGKISEDYWEKFIKYRRAVDDILRDTSVPTK